MKTKAVIFCGILFLTACNNAEREQKLKDLSFQDSTLLEQARKKDSSISSYIRTMNVIQDNLDSLKQREKILTVRSSENSGSNVIDEIRAMDNLILKNDREIAQLQTRIRKMGTKDAELDKIVAHLHTELADRDSSIVSLQKSLSQTNESMKAVVEQFNDSMATLNIEKAENSSLHTAINTVYYAVGTMKELKQNGVIDKEGGVIGIGRTAKLKKQFNAKYFTRADMTTLSSIPLYAKFSKVITNQPDNAFTVKGTTKSDSLQITDPDAFWNGSKYLVVAVK
jgi:hypothetical protein